MTEKPDPSEWTEKAIREIRHRLALNPSSFLVGYCIYTFDVQTKGIGVSANFIGDGHQKLDAETEAQFMELNQEFTKIVQRIFSTTDFNPLEAWENVSIKYNA